MSESFVLTNEEFISLSEYFGRLIIDFAKCSEQITSKKSSKVIPSRTVGEHNYKVIENRPVGFLKDVSNVSEEFKRNFTYLQKEALFLLRILKDSLNKKLKFDEGTHDFEIFLLRLFHLELSGDALESAMRIPRLIGREVPGIVNNYPAFNRTIVLENEEEKILFIKTMNKVVRAINDKYASKIMEIQKELGEMQFKYVLLEQTNSALQDMLASNETEVLNAAIRSLENRNADLSNTLNGIEADNRALKDQKLPFMDKKHPYFAPEIHAAVNTWLALFGENGSFIPPDRDAKTPIPSSTNQIRKHLKETSKLSNEGVDRLKTVCNPQKYKKRGE